MLVKAIWCSSVQSCVFVTYAHMVPLDEGVNVPAQVLLLLVKQEHDLCRWQILLEDAIALPSLLSALPFDHSSPSSPLHPPHPFLFVSFLPYFWRPPQGHCPWCPRLWTRKTPYRTTPVRTTASQTSTWHLQLHDDELHMSTGALVHGVVVHAWLSSKKYVVSP